MRFARLLTAALLALAPAASAAPRTEISWWHAMTGELGARLEAVAADFNASQPDYTIVPVYKGSYPQTMTAAIAAFHAGKPPAIVQVFEVGTGTMMAAADAIYPAYQLMADNGRSIDKAAFIPAIAGYFSDRDGNLLAFPFNSSTPILYYNKGLFARAGLDPEQPPATWAALEADARAIVASGAAPCGFTTAWPSWVMLENLLALHALPFATRDNGFGGTDARLVFNNALTARHWDNLKRWQDAGLFQWGGAGAGDGAAPKFYAQTCAITLDSSAALAEVLAHTPDFATGVGTLPYYDDVKGAPQNSIIGGASLWVLRGAPPAEYAGVAAFFAYLMRPEVQAGWHQASGYLPITRAAYDLGVSRGYYAANPGRDVAIRQLTRNPPTPNSRGLRLGNFLQIRDVIDDEMGKVLSGAKSGQKAANDAVIRGDRMLRAFEAAN